MSQYPNQSSFAQQPMPPTKQYFRFDFWRSFNYIFENPKGFQNTLICALCVFVPIVGPVALYGYQLEVMHSLHLSRGQTYADFDFDRLGDYLIRGLWVVLLILIASLIVLPIVWVVGFVWMMLGAGVSLAGPEAAPFVFLVFLPVMFLFFSMVSVLLGLTLFPMVLRAGWGLDFGSAFDLKFVLQFVGNVWKRFLVTSLLMIPVGFAACFVGMIAACVGIYFTIAVVQLMTAHLAWQHYELHLSKGGQPVLYRINSQTPSHGSGDWPQH